jgi:hypothetical protein
VFVAIGIWLASLSLESQRDATPNAKTKDGIRPMTKRNCSLALGVAALLAAHATAGNGRTKPIGSLNTDKLLAVPRAAGEQRTIVGGFKSLSGMDSAPDNPELLGSVSAPPSPRRTRRIGINDVTLKRGVFESATKVDGFSLKQKHIEAHEADRFNGAYLVQGATHRLEPKSVGSSETITIHGARTEFPGFTGGVTVAAGDVNDAPPSGRGGNAVAMEKIVVQYEGSDATKVRHSEFSITKPSDAPAQNPLGRYPVHFHDSGIPTAGALPATTRRLPPPPPKPAVSVYFNPKELTVDKPAPWQKSVSTPDGKIVQPVVAAPADRTRVSTYHFENAWPTKSTSSPANAGLSKKQSDATGYYPLPRPIRMLDTRPSGVSPAAPGAATKRAPPPAAKGAPRAGRIGGRRS